MKEIKEIVQDLEELLSDIKGRTRDDETNIVLAFSKIRNLESELLSHIGKAFDAGRETEENDPWVLPIMKYKSKSDYIKELGL